MSVVPDMLLTSMTVAKPQAAQAKVTPDKAQASNQDGSSFSQVYAKERQSKPAERSETASKNTRDTKAAANSSDSNPPSADAKQPAVADDGKSLPAAPAAVAETDDAADAPQVVDPALLLGMFDMQPIEVDVAELGLPEADPLAAASLLATLPVSVGVNQATADVDMGNLELLPGVPLTLEQSGISAKVNGQPLVAVAGEQASATQSGGQLFASAMAAMGVNADATATATDADSLQLGDLPLGELSSEGLESLKEGTADLAPEQFVSKLSALSQAIGQQTSQVARVPLVPGQPVAMQQAGWSDGVVDKVMWMSSQNLKSAEIQLDPAELGRLDVRISLNQDQTQISFASAHAGVREALESQVHRLRDMFNQQGLNLADVNVSDQSQGRAWQGQEGDGRNRGSSLADSHAAEEEVSVGSLEVREAVSGSGRGMVDYYA